MGGGGVSCAEAELTTIAAPHNSIAAHKILSWSLLFRILLFISLTQLSVDECTPCQWALIATARDGWGPERFHRGKVFLSLPASGHHNPGRAA
jgi:hypothetical protein